jgi:hypothetical protein
MEFVKTLLEEQKELLTEELRFAEDLEYAETKQRLTEVTDALNKLFITNVSNRRELLTAFLQYGKQRHYTPLTEEQIEALLNDFEGSL